jgi:hypothetical protein
MKTQRRPLLETVKNRQGQVQATKELQQIVQKLVRAPR